MEKRLAKTIGNLSNWEALAQFEKNARERKRLTDEVADAINIRSAELGRAFISERTGLDLSKLSPAKEKIVQAVSEYVGIMRRQGKYPSRTLEQLRNRGLLDAAESAVCRATPTQGFQALADAALEDLSYEKIVIDHADEFTPRAVWFSRRTLGLPNDSDSPPATADGDVQTRTTTLIQWLKKEAESNGGIMPPYTNANAASILGMQDMSRYGRVFGNIQSRIDFACYICGLPPLGLAADAPFAMAWSQQGRDWPFPVAAMQAAAQSHLWSADDFDNVLRETERLPGQAHVFWNEALSADETKVKTWAFSLHQSSPKSLTEAQYQQAVLDKAVLINSNKKTKYMEPAGALPVPPKAGNVASSSYQRNPAVAADALEQAGFKCEIADTHETFITSAKNLPYIEAHHLVPISKQGNYDASLDVTANIVALCPMCHKLLHHGRATDKKDFLKRLFSERKVRLSEKGILLGEQMLLSYYSNDLLEEDA